MKLFHYLAALLLLSPGFASAQGTKISALPSATTVTGSETVPIVQSGTTKAAAVKILGPGVINVRTMYGAVPDASTDNSTAIANAFTAANAFTGNGAPTVYFDCDPTASVCQYNYGGSGTSAINMTRPTTLECAPGVTLNYTGTAHAVEVGATSKTQVDTGIYAIKNCRFTGGASYTAGIYVNDYISTAMITGNEFLNFGNQTAYSIVFSGNNWTPTVSHNFWRDTDGFTKNMIDAHSGTNVGLLFSHNKNECETAGGTACSVATTGLGVWTCAGWVTNNEIKYHYPAVRICGSAYQGLWISDNVFEGNTNGTKPAITFGNPGTTGAHVNMKTFITNNGFYWPNSTGNPPYLAPETASSGNHTLDNLTFSGNNLQSNLPSSVTTWINTGTGSPLWTGRNFNATANEITQTSTVPLTDRSATTFQSVSANASNGTSIVGAIPVGDSKGVNLSAAMYHHFATPLLCSDSSGSGTAQTCNTSPKFDTSGSAMTAVAGDMIIYKTTTTNTGALTIAVNGGTAANVIKPSSGASLSAGDLPSGRYFPLVFDGTAWEMVGR